jgi:two-component system CheB/CheR fusion protein
MPIDHFLRALAEQKCNRAIGVILSGSGSDGTLDLSEIQAHGGVTFAQDGASAKYDGMPPERGCRRLRGIRASSQRNRQELARIARHPYVAREIIPAAVDPAPPASKGLSTVFQILRRYAGVDFTHYRQTTILRRVQGRMVVHKIDKIEEYLNLVQTNPAEIKALYQDMLISVTSFFRNSRVFDA